MKSHNRAYFYLLSFLEGSCVMACEIIGARMLSPYFGGSLYVWAAALGITLGGLMTGYFLGGLISKGKMDNRKALYTILLAAAAFLFVMPYTSTWIMQAALQLDLRTAVVLSLSVFMFPPLVFMGMVSPLIINLVTTEIHSAGNSAGNVYAISTLGGILTTFFLGFYIIPDYGIANPAMAGGAMLAVLPAWSLIQYRRNYLGLVVLVVMAVLGVAQPSLSRSNPGYHVLYQSDGILGQIKVIDFSEHGRECRGLVVNNTLQTVVDKDDPEYDYWPYTRAIQDLVRTYPAGSKALLLGMGAGTVLRRILPLGFETDIVEIDERMTDIASRFFDLTPGLVVSVDDARHFIRVSHQKYDVVIFDVFRGEEAPVHVLTRQSLQEARRILAPSGVIIINFYGYLEGSLGLLTRSLIKTLTASGFDYDAFATPGAPDQRNIVIAGWQDREPSPLRPEAQSNTLDTLNIKQIQLPAKMIQDAYVLTDDTPQLQLFARAAMQWRRLYNAYFLK